MGGALIYEYSRIQLRVISFHCFPFVLFLFVLFLPVVLGSTPVLWAIHSLVPGHPTSVGPRLSFLAWT